MGWKNMHVSQIISGSQKHVAWDYEEVLTAEGDGDWILIPDMVSIIVVTVSFQNGASGKVQDTSERTATIKNGDPVTNDWDAGIVSITTRDSADPPAAIRAVQTSSGIMKMTVTAR